MDVPYTSSLSRRDLLKLGGAAVAAGAAGSGLPLVFPAGAAAQAPKRGGTFRIRFHLAPVHFDPQQTVAFTTMVPLSFTHSRLVKVKAGSAVKPGTTPIEPDLAESWTQPNDTTYIFKLRRGARWHNKPPVNGREVTAEDIKYTYERFGGSTNPNRGILEQVEKIEVVDKYTVKFTMKEPFAWLLDALASTSTWIIAKEVGGAVRGSQEAGELHRDGPVDARALRAQSAPHLRAQPELLRARAALRGQRRHVHRHRSRLRLRGLAHRPLRLRPGVRDGGPAERPRGGQAAQAGPADPGLHRGLRRHHLGTSRPGAVQGHPHAARPRRGQQLEGDSRDQQLVAGRIRRAQSRHARRVQGLVHPHRSAPPGGTEALRVRPAGSEEAPRGGRLPQRLQDHHGDHGRLRPRLHGRGGGDARELEEGRHRGGAEDEGVRRLHLHRALRQVRQDGHAASSANGPTPTAISTATSCPGSPSTPPASTIPSSPT